MSQVATKPALPLAGIKVLDLTHYASGPVATMVLADMGADVVKVEPPGGEPSRRLGVNFPGGWSTFFLALNRNKRSLCVDYKSESGREILASIATQVDVVVENSRPNFWRSLQLDYDHVSQGNPEVVYASISGFGQTGPRSEWLSMDPIAQAAGGIMSLTGTSESGPVKVGAPIADVESGRALAFGILLALYERQKTGRGQRVSTSLLDTIVGMLSMREVEYQFSGQEPELLGTAHGQIVPGQVFATKNGHVMMTLYTNEHFVRWCTLVRRPDLAADPRFADNVARRRNAASCIAAVQGVLAEMSTSEVLELLAGKIPVGPVSEFKDLWNDAQLHENDVLIDFNQPGVGTVRTVGSPVHLGSHKLGVRLPCPLLGEHSSEILKEFGFVQSDIEKLTSCNVVVQATTGDDAAELERIL